MSFGRFSSVLKKCLIRSSGISFCVFLRPWNIKLSLIDRVCKSNNVSFSVSFSLVGFATSAHRVVTVCFSLFNSAWYIWTHTKSSKVSDKCKLT